MRRIALRAVVLAVSLGAICLAATPAGAQAFKPDEADKAAAVKEGNVNWYTSTPFPLVQLLADRYTADTGVKVTLLRSGGEAVLRRFLQEYQAGQAGPDIITMSDSGAASGMTRRGMFVPFRPEGFDRVVDEPPSSGGTGTGPMPTEYLLAALASCYALALNWAAGKRGITLPDLVVTATGTYDGPKFCRLQLNGACDAPAEQVERLLEPALRVCYVSNTIALSPPIEVALG